MALFIKKITIFNGRIVQEDVQEDFSFKARKAEKQIEHQDKYKRALAVYEIGKFGVKAKKLVPNLIEVLEKDEYYRARQYASETLGKIGAGGKRTAQALINTALNDPHSEVQKAASKALVNFWPFALKYIAERSKNKASFETIKEPAGRVLREIGLAIKDRKIVNAPPHVEALQLVSQHIERDEHPLVVSDAFLFTSKIFARGEKPKKELVGEFVGTAREAVKYGEYAVR